SGNPTPGRSADGVVLVARDQGALRNASCLRGSVAPRPTCERPAARSASGGAVGLRVAVIPAVDGTPKSDPVFWLSGGPGGAATEDFGWTPAAFSLLPADREFVMVGQTRPRGSH